MDRRLFTTALAAAFTAPVACTGARVRDEQHVLLFAYFTTANGSRKGLQLAASDDGLTFRPLRDGASFLAPEVGESQLMRDPCLFKGPLDRDPYHLVWTTSWGGNTLGHASSHDLIHWSAQQAVPVMANYPGTRNVWAPEVIWDATSRRYVVFWSSTVPGMFDDSAGKSEDDYNHRLFYTTTEDFRTFTPAMVLYDPGFSIIDGTFLTDARGGLHLIIKDERVDPVKKHLRITAAASPVGPFGPLSEPFTGSWVEGPTAVRVGNDYLVYFDVYREHRYGAVRSTDLNHWEDIGPRISMPPGARHGTLLRVPRTLLAKIEALHSSLSSTVRPASKHSARG